ncbi:MAG: hypothetical protein BZ135_07420 [Methanosphaera sp. rholeuAM6]|nr:MAG: hypothetical protein BZ135_07420 [Methanosphaera sp. rholeuAM6]
MNEDEKRIIKSLNKLAVQTRFISLYENRIYINNLKFSKFSRGKEEEFHREYPDIKVIRSTLFQKICIKVSRTIKNQIKPRTKLYIADDDSMENILLYIVLEPYRRKYGVEIVETPSDDSINVDNNCLNDFTLKYMNLMINGEKIEDELEENTIYPLMHIPHQWIADWITSEKIPYKSRKEYDECIEQDMINFLEEHIPNVQESIKQSVNYLNEYNQLKEE